MPTRYAQSYGATEELSRFATRSLPCGSFAERLVTGSLLTALARSGSKHNPPLAAQTQVARSTMLFSRCAAMLSRQS
jgi:hypothetical protein